MAIGAVMLLSSCEPSFSPIKENDRYYSIYGFLNASADTQFIRVEKLRDSLFSDTPADLDAQVRLTNVTTGQSQVMQDSIFEYSVGKAHNYYATLDINPTETYLLEVSNDDETASAEVDIPESFPEPNLINMTTVETRDIDRLITLKALYYASAVCVQGGPNDPPCPDNPTVFTYEYQHLQDTVHRGNGVVHTRIDTTGDLEEVALRFSESGFNLHKIEIVVAAGTQDWPDFLNLDIEAAALPDVASNVEGGVGLLGGVITDTIAIPLSEGNLPENNINR